MRLLPGFSLSFVLALLLTGTTPMGTGAGIHRLDLVHPLFSHVHIINGRVLTHEQVQQRGGGGPSRTAPGSAVDAGSGANEAFNDVGISPTVPMQPIALLSGSLLSRIRLALALPAGRMRETPPDPPPTSAA